MSMNAARKADRAANAGKVVRRQVVAYWRALVAMLPCNRNATCGTDSIGHRADRPGQRL
jgi:hypothetical protein